VDRENRADVRAIGVMDRIFCQFARAIGAMDRPFCQFVRAMDAMDRIFCLFTRAIGAVDRVHAGPACPGGEEKRVFGRYMP
jgi:hypothetical protein